MTIKLGNYTDIAIVLVYIIVSYLERSYGLVLVHPTTLKVELGEFIEFNCLGSNDVTGIHWTRADGLPLLPHVKVDGPVLQIDSASFTDSGFYICRANGINEGEESISELIVTGKFLKYLIISKVVQLIYYSSMQAQSLLL